MPTNATPENFARPRANTQQNKENVHNGVVEEKGKRAQWGS
jgi:hypothetical protein